MSQMLRQFKFLQRNSFVFNIIIIRKIKYLQSIKEGFPTKPQGLSSAVIDSQKKSKMKAQPVLPRQCVS